MFWLQSTFKKAKQKKTFLGQLFFGIFDDIVKVASKGTAAEFVKGSHQRKSAGPPERMNMWWFWMSQVWASISIQGVKSLWGDRIIFPRLGTGDTDRWRVNKGLFATCECLQCPILEKRDNPPNVI